MPYLALDLDAKRKCGMIARALGLSPGEVCWGLLELWEFAWREKRAQVNGIELRACVGSHGEITAALEQFGFLEANPEGWRVKGADRYLTIREAQVEAGKKHAGNLKRGTEKPARVAGETREAETSFSRVSPGSTSGSTREAFPALTPSTEHRAPNTRSAAVAAEQRPPPEKLAVVVTEPTAPPSAWSGADFWRWFQSKRQKAGFTAEKYPRTDPSHWFSQAMSVVEGDVELLKEAVLRFGDDRYWQAKDPPLPWAGFTSQCPPKWIPRKERPRAEG